MPIVKPAEIRLFHVVAIDFEEDGKGPPSFSRGVKVQHPANENRGKMREEERGHN